MTSLVVRRAQDRRFAAAGLGPSRQEAAAPTIPTIRRTERSTTNASQVRALSTPNLAVAALRLVAHSIATFVTVLALSLAFLAVAPRAFGFRAVVVTSGSMKPSLDVADAVVINPVRDDLAIGTVIDYQIGDASRIHRIVELTDDGYRTKGDANQTSDNEIVPFAAVRGAGVLVVPFAGLPSWLAATHRWVHLGLLGLTLAVAGRMSRRRWLESTPSAVGRSRRWTR